MKNFINTKITDFYIFYDNEYLTLTRKNKTYFIFSRTIEAELNKAIFMETSTTRDTTIKIFKTTELPKDFYEKIEDTVKRQRFLNKVLICSKVSNVEGFINIKELDYFSYDKKKKELSNFLYVSRLNYSLTLKRTRKPFNNINNSLYTIKKLIKEELINENEKDKDKDKDKELIANELEKESSFLIQTENHAETDFYDENEFNKEFAEQKMDMREEALLDLNEKDEYTLEQTMEEDNFKYTKEEIEELQENLAVLLPIKEFTFYYDRREQNKIKWAFTNIKSKFNFPIVYNNLIYYNHFTENFHMIVNLLLKMNLSLNINNFKILRNRNRKFLGEKDFLSFFFFIEALLIQMIKFFFLITNFASNSFKNVLANTFLKEFEAKLILLLRNGTNVLFSKQRIKDVYIKDNFDKDSIIFFMKAFSHKNASMGEKFEKLNVPHFLQGMRIEFGEEEAENVLDTFFYNKEGLFFMDDYALKTTLLEELFIAKFDFYITQVLDEDSTDVYYSTLPLDFEETIINPQ